MNTREVVTYLVRHPSPISLYDTREVGPFITRDDAAAVAGFLLKTKGIDEVRIVEVRSKVWEEEKPS